MINALAVILIALAAGAFYLGVIVNAGDMVSETGYQFRWALFPIAAVVLATAIGLWRRLPWARYMALGVCLFGAGLVIAATVMLVYFIPMWALIIFGWGDQGGVSMKEAGPWIAAALLGIPVTLYLIRRAWRYLKSDAVRLAFGEHGAQAAQRRELLGVLPAVTTIVLGVLAFYAFPGRDTWTKSALFVPASLRTEKQQAWVEKSNAMDAARFVRSWMFSDDEERVVFASEDSFGFHILDVRSGQLTRKHNALYYYNGPSPWRSISPDAKRFVTTEGQIVTLADDVARKLKSLPPAFTSLGFADGDRLLVFTGEPYEAPRAIQLRLIDLTRDLQVYEKELIYQRTDVDPRRGEWSPDRSKYVWVDGDKRLHVLEVATGELSSRDCPCNAHARVVFFREGDRIYLDPEGVGVYSRPLARGPLYELATGTFLPEALSWGDILYASGREDRLIQWSEFPSPMLRQFRANDFETPTWAMPLDHRLSRVTPDGTMLVSASSSAPWQLRIAPLDGLGAPAEASFRPVRTVLGEKWRIEFSPRGSLLLLVRSPNIEIIRTEALTQPEPVSLAIDLRSGKRLDAKAGAKDRTE